MAKGTRVQRRNGSRVFRRSPYPLQSRDDDNSQNLCQDKCSKAIDRKHWEDVTCPVCKECPHKAVLLLCASYDKGCRPYMCGTSFRYSNCLDQYKKAYTKVVSSNGTADHPNLLSDGGWPTEKCGEASEPACPLCRGQVKGWTVVEPAREYLNAKKRSCMQDDCSFVGTYRELRKHMRANHPSARPREVDPVLEQKWRNLEREREHDDVISTIRSSMPGALVFGDYVIERNNDDSDLDEVAGFAADDADRNGAFELGFDRNLVNLFLLLHAFGPSGNGLGRRLRQAERGNNQTPEDQRYDIRQTSLGGELNFLEEEGNDNNDESGDVGMSLVSRLRRHGRMLLGRSGRRRRGREGSFFQR